MPTAITSLTNPRVKQAVKLRQRSHRDKLGLMLIEGYREVRRAVANQFYPTELFICPELFLGSNEAALIDEAQAGGAFVLPCSRSVFEKLSYRDRPDGLLAVAPQLQRNLDAISVTGDALLLVAEAIEKPGNLGTILRSADAVGVNGVIVCDRCTDICNPNVVRASIGTLFSLPVVEASTAETRDWLAHHGVQIVAASPDATRNYTDVDMTRATAIVVGTEQLGLSPAWNQAADVRVRIPMLGQADSLNVASATTILLYEAIRQRGIG